MNLPAAIYAIRWLVRDTFRQSRASGIYWLMLAVSAVCILVCLSVSVTGGERLHHPGEPADFLTKPLREPGETDAAYEKRLEAFRAEARRHGVDVAGGELSLAFGAFRVEHHRDTEEEVHYLQLLLAGGVADAAGILLALVWTAGFLPTFLEPSAAAVLLAKPIPRWSLLIGKYIGVLVFVGFQALIFVGGTWLALAVRTGVWDLTYLLCVPLLLLHFAIFFSFSTLLAVLTRSTVACVFGSILFWLLCWGMNFGRHAVVITPDLQTMPALFQGTVEVGYWLLPKPADLGMLLFNALGAGGLFTMPFELQTIQQTDAFHPALSVLASLAFTGVTLALAAYEFARMDY